MSTHRIPVVPIKLEPHPNADSLSIVRIDDCQVVVRTSDWEGVDRGIHVPPDYLIPRHLAEFAAKGDEEMVRIKPVRLRGELSWGLLLPMSVLGFKSDMPSDARPIGEDVMGMLGIERYEPPVPMISGGDNIEGPNLVMAPKYDVEPFEKYASKVFTPGETVFVTEKIHGANSRFVYSDGEFYSGSRSNWKKYDPRSIWWRAIETHPEIRVFCEKNPNTVLYGEVYGPVQSLRYGSPKQVHFAAFDILRDGEWMSIEERRKLCRFFGVPHVPTLGQYGFNLELLRSLASGPSLVEGADNIREGVVVEPQVPRNDPKLGRVQLKIVSEEYLAGNY